MLSHLGVTTTYYDPLIGAGIADLIQDNTALVFTESPGSLTFEMQDIPAITAAAAKRGVPVIMDNTWATGLYFKPFEHGVAVSISACTKYIVGHADAMLGADHLGRRRLGEQGQEGEDRSGRLPRHGGNLSRPARPAHARRAPRTSSQIRS